MVRDGRARVERVVVYAESNVWLGHGATQRRVFLDTMLSMGWTVILLAWEELAPSRETVREFEHAAGKLHVTSIPATTGRRTRERWTMLQSLIEKAEQDTGWRADLVFLSWYDGLRPRRKDLKSCLGILTRPWVGFYFMPTHFRRGTSVRLDKRFQQAWVDYQLLRQPLARGLAVLDEGLGFPLRWVLGGKPLVTMPEITETEVLDAEEARQLRRLAGTRPIIALMGHLSPRKGVLNFLRASAGIDPAKAFFLMAGKFAAKDFRPHEQEELERLMRPRENLHLHLSHIEDARLFNGLFNACDIHVLVYQNFFHSSGLLAKAAVFEKPVIVAERHCMGERVERLGMGWTVPAKDPDALRVCILRVLARTPDEEARLRRGWRTYQACNTREALRESLQQLCAP